MPAGASYNALNRYRMALIGLFAVATALQMWAANVTLNLAGGGIILYSELPLVMLTACRYAIHGSATAWPGAFLTKQVGLFCMERLL